MAEKPVNERVAVLESLVDTLSENSSAMAHDIKNILQSLNQSKGAMTSIIFIANLGSGLIMMVLSHFWH